MNPNAEVQGSVGVAEPLQTPFFDAPAYYNGDPAYRTFVEKLNYLEPHEIAQVLEAYRFSEEAHFGQKRQSGEPYIVHPLAVAETLVEWRLDAQVLMAGLLHDVMEDTHITKPQITLRFGRQVADLVDGLSKIERIEWQSYQEAQAENFRKMLMAMARDLRIMLIKLADRLHNMRTMGSLRPEKRQRIAKETLEIYAPIAIRLGLNNVSRQLQDLSFQQIHPRRFEVLSRAMKTVRGNRRELLTKILDGVNAKLKEAKLEVNIFGREKTLYSIYRKMLEKRLSFSQVLDIYGFRVIVKDAPSCYLALGALHSLYKPIPGKFKDYIAIPKANGYQSLHTALIGPYGTPVEFQIRSEKMDHVAEEGIAAHWLYKDSEQSGAELQAQTHKWLQSLIELQSASRNSSEFLEHVKVDLFPDEVYVFTPKGKILTLPRGATVIDFAYAVHTDIGHRCVAARIDHELIPLSAKLANGNQVEIITTPHANPNPAWLEYVKTSRARTKIRQFLKIQQQEGASLLGENMLNQELRALGVASTESIPDAVWNTLVRGMGRKSRREIYMDIGVGLVMPQAVAEILAAHEEVEQGEYKAPLPIVVGDNTAGMNTHFSTCCYPIPGDPILGVFQQGDALWVHTHTCKTLKKIGGIEPSRWVHMDWKADSDQLFDVPIRITARNIRGAFGRIATAIGQADSNIIAVNNRDEHSPVIASDTRFLIQVTGRQHLARLIRHLRRLPDVVKIVREQQS